MIGRSELTVSALYLIVAMYKYIMLHTLLIVVLLLATKHYFDFSKISYLARSIISDYLKKRIIILLCHCIVIPLPPLIVFSISPHFPLYGHVIIECRIILSLLLIDNFCCIYYYGHLDEWSEPCLRVHGGH